jgi:heme A synthase
MQRNNSLFKLKNSKHVKFPSLSIFVAIFVILGLIYSVMLLGVYITSSHQGLSCLTWPMCPNGFNFPPPKYFYEHVHRFMVLILSIALFSFTAFAFKRLSNKNIRIKLSIASILLAAQIILGWLIIYSRLNPIVVASHLSNAVALFGITLVTLLSIYNEIKKEKVKI